MVAQHKFYALPTIISQAFVQIAAAHANHKVAFAGILLDPVSGSLQAVHQHRVGDLRRQLCAGNGGVVGLAAAMMGVITVISGILNTSTKSLNSILVRLYVNG